jgi:hypothetical protein
LRLYARAARHHLEAARLMDGTDSESAERQRRFAAFIRARRETVVKWAKDGRQP